MKKSLTLFTIFVLSATTALAATPPENFATPEKAVDALVAASKANDKSALIKLLGSEADSIINSGDKEADKEGRQKFVEAYETAHKFEANGDKEQTLIVGKNEWPLPIPLVQAGGKWHFDTPAGEQEILDRRIGHNELTVIEICRAYVEAQEEFSNTHKNGKTPEFAQKFLSADGKQDGLYWDTGDSTESPLGPYLAFAEASNKTHTPYHGYYYKILTGQSEHAHGGKVDYIVDGHMTKGFALLAYPAKYGDSGIMTFIVNQHGIVHERDLGKDTATAAASITSYDPDDSWQMP